MRKKKDITPEFILQKFHKRLKKKTDEVEYLVCMNRQFEKWLENELVLSMSDVALPVAYNSQYNEFRYQHEDGTWEQISDITARRSVQEPPGVMRPDICIAERPFISHYADKKTWIIRSEEDRVQCEREYSRTGFHYVELNQLKWTGVNDTEIVSIVMSGDMKKYSAHDLRSRKSVCRPASIISLCFVPFWNTAKPLKKCSILASKKAVKRIRTQITAECDQHFGMEGRFVSKSITRELCLLMLYYSL
ncbi:MAG: hypothetical protein AB1552_11215 [Nitrospirota bacterium]